MIVSKLEISGFRGIRTGAVNLSAFSVLLGPNNCGKTTITEALALVLGRDRLIRPLTEHDFHGSDPGETARVLIIGTLTGFDPNTPDQHHEWFREGRGVIKWQDAETYLIKAVSDKATDKLACQIAYCARFDREILETVSIRYFYDADSEVDPFDENNPVVPLPHELIRQVGFFLVPASRTWDRMISFSSELFRRVVSYVGGKPAAAVLAERDRLRSPINPLEADANMSDLVQAVNDDIRVIFGKSSELKLRVTTTDSDGILEAIVPHFGHGEGVPLPSRRQGSGLISLQTLILLMRFGRTRIESGDGFMMVIEEPELHVPPPLQRKLVRLMQSMTTQTIITTHSPTVAAIPDPHQIGMVVNAGGELTVRLLLDAPLTAATVNPIRRLLIADRDTTVQALMHPHALIPEGKTDANWLRLMVRCLELRPSDNYDAEPGFAHEVGVIVTPDARTTDVYKYISTIHPSVTCLFDGDDAGHDYLNLACQLPKPPKTIILWANGWEMEDLIRWIVEPDPGILASPDLAAAGVPQTMDEFEVALKGNLKKDDVVHSLIADVMMESQACRRRIAHVLRLIADLSAGRAPSVGAATSAQHANGVTTIWTFNNAVQGI